MKNMVELAGGTFRMGCERFYPEERPVRNVSVAGFWIDRHPVTVAEFRRFVKETGHVTWAEVPPKPEDYPDVEPKFLVPGSLLFHKTTGPVDLQDYRNWWRWQPGADWRHPEGPGSNVGGREL
ncbi:MAG TPA: SUMF1/EgtB/PvdO family nonheme iron enzyme, partial [Gaiellaceae bacterium]|nr:SUMF1/EgtB/PvdO family nonheme iron enzyme [Gaiellaceae bacterium]